MLKYFTDIRYTPFTYAISLALPFLAMLAVIFPPAAFGVMVLVVLAARRYRRRVVARRAAAIAHRKTIWGY